MFMRFMNSKRDCLKAVVLGFEGPKIGKGAPKLNGLRADGDGHAFNSSGVLLAVNKPILF